MSELREIDDRGREKESKSKVKPEQKQNSHSLAHSQLGPYVPHPPHKWTAYIPSFMTGTLPTL